MGKLHLGNCKDNANGILLLLVLLSTSLFSSLADCRSETEETDDRRCHVVVVHKGAGILLALQRQRGSIMAAQTLAVAVAVATAKDDTMKIAKQQPQTAEFQKPPATIQRKKYITHKQVFCVLSEQPSMKKKCATSEPTTRTLASLLC